MTDFHGGVHNFLYDSIDSTNEEGRRRIAAGDLRPMWIAARQQTAGRGRQGRAWSSQPGNLAATYIATCPGELSDAGLLSFAAALAVADTIEVLAPDQQVGLKWPNDVLLNGRKACGILLESFGVHRGYLRIAIGIGLNLKHHPSASESNWPPTSIEREIGAAPDFDAAFSTLADALAVRLRQTAEQGFSAIRTAWLARAIGVGGSIEVRLPRQTLAGRFAGLDITGALVLEQETGRRLISAGDVFFPEAS